MATDQSDESTDDFAVGPERETSAPLGIAHLTVVPANADQSS
jgi:hypothetical protein